MQASRVGELHALQAFAGRNRFEFRVAVKKTRVVRSRSERAPAEYHELRILQIEWNGKTVKSGVTTKLDGATVGYGIAEGSSALGRAHRSVLGRNSQGPADAVVIFYAAYRGAVAAQGGESDVVLFGERSLKPQPLRKRISRRLILSGC